MFYSFRSDCSYHENDTQSVGQVYIFDTPLTNISSLIITGTNEFQQLGFALHSGNFGGDDYLFITSATAGKLLYVKYATVIHYLFFQIHFFSGAVLIQQFIHIFALNEMLNYLASLK